MGLLKTGTTVSDGRLVQYLFRELLFRTGDASHYFENIKYPRKFDTFYIPPISTDRTERPSEAEIQAVVDEWSMDDCRVTYTSYDDDGDEFEDNEDSV
eukprot:scaffold284690_cov64-Attheya_sp.AAC.2